MRSKKYCIKMAPMAWQRVVRSTSRFYDTHVKDKVSFGLYLSQQHNEEPLFDKPINLDVTFYMPFPKTLKDKAHSIYHSTPPYLDCLSKFFLDALKDIIIIDSKIICSLSIKKVYDKQPRTEWIITEVS
jgi:Holliday junction resolvase RusA-like endonuclease